jgi:Uncharacterized protein conserved in bacteria
MRKDTVYTIGLLVIAFIGCKFFSPKPEQIIADTTITRQTSFNSLFLDSATIANFLSQHEEYKPFKQQYFDFYKERNYQYAWFDTLGMAEQSHNFINLLNDAIGKLDDSSLYNEALYKLYAGLGKRSRLNDTNVLKAELYFTGQFFLYASKEYKGSDVNAKDLGWFIPRKKINLTALLDSTINTKTKQPDKFISINSQYYKLQVFLSRYKELAKKTWDTIAYPAKPIIRGIKDNRLIKIKRRLFLLGDLSIKDSTKIYDAALLPAVKKFQKRFGLVPDGVIGKDFLRELNIKPKQRIEQLLVNMERSRWMPAETDSNYIMVNIPEYKLHVYDSGKQLFDMNVIVGKATSGTVIFTSKLRYIVFSPYWLVPPSIVKKEILPSIKKNRSYLAENNMEIYGKDDSLPHIRQKPGGNNSLGQIKFLFPNNYDIYFHDTPNRELFSASNRSFSHGCIRLGEPKKFAQYLLRADTAKIWKSNVIDSCMHLQKEKWVTVKKPVPVFIVYFTTWVDKNGILNFRKDIYDHDKKMNEKLFATKLELQSSDHDSLKAVKK